MKIASRIENINEYYFSEKLREIDALNKAGKQIINLGIGSPDLPPHTEVIKTLQEAATKDNQHGYQNYKGSEILRSAISKWYLTYYNIQIDADKEILPLIGSKEGIMHICMTYINQGDLVLIPDPGYPTYSSAAKIAGGDILTYDLTSENHWQPDFNALELQIETFRNQFPEKKSNRTITFLNYPHMPTGQLPTKNSFEEWITFAKKMNLLLIHDNPYSFILNNAPMSILEIPGAMEVAIELNSLSKSHNMAGWRIGFAIGQQKYINDILKFKSNMDSGMFLPLQLAAAKALELKQDWFQSINNIYTDRRMYVFELLDLLNCTYDKNQAGLFVWAEIPNKYENGFAMSDEILHQAGIFITPGGIFGKNGNKYIRISLCSPKEKIIQAIKNITNMV